MKMDKSVWIIIIIAVVAFFLIRQMQVAPEVERVKEDEGVSLKVLMFDLNGNPMGQLKMSTVGGVYGVGSIQIESTITRIGNVPVMEISDIQATNVPGTNLYGPAIASYNKNFELTPASPSNVQTSSNIDVTQLEFGDVTFTMDVDGEYKDEYGNTVEMPTRSGNVIINIISDTCSDGTSEGQCSSSNRGKYCSGGNLIDGATTYGCDCCTSVGETYPCGWEPEPGNVDVCYDELCGTGSHAGACIVDTQNTQFPQYCELDGSQTDACNRCDSCADDYHNNPTLGCNIGSDPAVCTYTAYSGDITVTLASP